MLFLHRRRSSLNYYWCKHTAIIKVGNDVTFVISLPDRMKNLPILITFLLFFQQGFAQKISDPYSLMLLKRFDLLKGITFPALEMEREDGTMFNTSSLAGKTVYVDVWFTLCPPCLQEIPYSKTLRKYFAADTNIVFLN